MPVASVSVEPTALAVSELPTFTLDGLVFKAATGALSVTFTLDVAVDDKPPVSITVTMPTRHYQW